MMRVLYAAVFLAACAGAASATGYDDYSRGMDANNLGNSDLAILSFTAALADGDLVQTYIPVAYFGRARAYLRKGKCAEALTDFDEGIKLRTDNVDAYIMRAAANECLNKLDDAQADANFAIALQPNSFSYESLAHLKWNLGLFPQAAANYLQAFKLTSQGSSRGPYLVLWYAMSADRTGALDHAALATDVSALDSEDWPAPLLDFYRGKATAEKVYSIAANGGAQIATNQKCEAEFYIGEWHIARKDISAAKPLLQQAVGECPHGFIEYFAAQKELKRLP
jgi:lipoprotein NlpI